jgi:hypothetical protein
MKFFSSLALCALFCLSACSHWSKSGCCGKDQQSCSKEKCESNDDCKKKEMCGKDKHCESAEKCDEGKSSCHKSVKPEEHKKEDVKKGAKKKS